jgi:hypothetical protein
MSATYYPFGGSQQFGPPGQQYQIVSALPQPPSPAQIGNFFYVEGPPDYLYVLRQNAQGTLVYTKLGPRSLRVKMCSADFTPFGVGYDAGSLAIVPYDPAQPSTLISITWIVTDIVFRTETASVSGATSVQIARSTGTGAFSNVGYLNTTPVTIAQGLYEPTVRPAVITQTTVNSGDKLQAYYSALGTGASGFTLYTVLTETD